MGHGDSPAIFHLHHWSDRDYALDNETGGSRPDPCLGVNSACVGSVRLSSCATRVTELIMPLEGASTSLFRVPITQYPPSA